MPSEYAPKEDRGTFFVIVSGPEGATRIHERVYDEIERRPMPLVESGEVSRLLVRAPRTFRIFLYSTAGIVVNVLDDWARRRSAWEIMDDVSRRLADPSGVRAFPLMRQGFGKRIQKPVQFVIGGGTYAELAEWRDIPIDRIEESNPGLEGIDWDHKGDQASDQGVDRLRPCRRSRRDRRRDRPHAGDDARIAPGHEFYRGR